MLAAATLAAVAAATLAAAAALTLAAAALIAALVVASVALAALAVVAQQYCLFVVLLLSHLLCSFVAPLVQYRHILLLLHWFNILLQ